MVVLNIGGLKMNRIIKWYRAIDEGKRLAFLVYVCNDSNVFNGICRRIFCVKGAS